MNRMLSPEQEVAALKEQLAERDAEIKQLRQDLIAAEHDADYWEEMAADLKADYSEPLEQLVALRDKELAMGPESVLPCEWQQAWRKAGAEG